MARVRSEHPSWPAPQLEAEAKRQYEAAARAYYEQSLLTAHRVRHCMPNRDSCGSRDSLLACWLLVCCSQVRPRGKWGYYGYPVGYTKASGQMPDRAQNDELGWLLNASSGWFPTVYLNGRPGKFGTRCSALPLLCACRT